MLDGKKSGVVGPADAPHSGDFSHLDRMRGAHSPIDPKKEISGCPSQAADRLRVAYEQWPSKAGKREADGRAAERRFMARDLALISGQ